MVHMPAIPAIPNVRPGAVGMAVGAVGALRLRCTPRLANAHRDLSDAVVCSPPAETRHDFAAADEDAAAEL